jgi:hypothetical protein
MHGQRVSEIRFGRRLPRESRLGLLGGPRLSGCSPRSACGCGQAPGRRHSRPADTGSSPSSACGQAPGRLSACLSRRDIPGSMRPVPLRHAWPADPAQPGALASAVGYRGRLRLQSPPPRYGFLVIFPGPGTIQSGGTPVRRQPTRRSGCAGRLTGDRPRPLLGTISPGMPANSVGSLPPAEVRFLQPGKLRLGDRQPMPAIAHMICHSCGAHSEGLAPSKRASVVRCRCGGVRQIVRIVRHPRGGASPSLEDVERSVQERAADETLTRSRPGSLHDHGCASCARGRKTVRQGS